MAKQKLVPGAEFDFLSPEEADSLIADALGHVARPQVPLRAEASGKADSTGLVRLSVYTVPAGMIAVVTRLFVNIDSASYAAPFQAAGASLEVLRNDVVVDGFPLIAAAVGQNSLPCSIKDGIGEGVYLTNGDELAVRLTAVTANIGVVARMQGELLALTRERGGGKRHGG